MGKSKIQVLIKDFEKTQKYLDQLKKAPERVVNSTLKEAREKVPGWAATEVARVYNVDKDEVTTGNNKFGEIKVKAETISGYRIKIKGRLLTPYHFDMEPLSPAPSYKLKFQVKKAGGKKTLGTVKKMTKKQRQAIGKNFRREGTQNSDHSPKMLMYTGAKKEGAVRYIPFQRVSKNRKEVHVIKTVSLPQMIDNETVSANLQKKMDENLGKRVDHYLNFYTK